MWKSNEGSRLRGNWSAKKLLSAIAVGALVSATVSVSAADEALAAPDPASLTLTCTDGATLVSSLADEFSAGAPYVISALIADDITITASGADDCVIANVTGNEALAITGDVTVQGGTSTDPDELDVENSGAFTITAESGAVVTVYVDACSLPGSGIESDPWRVGNEDAALARAAFAQVGNESTTPTEQSCSLAGHYLQSSIIMAVDNTGGYPVNDTFTGVYDGDHYLISFTGESAARYPLFRTIAGEVKRLKLEGTVRTTNNSIEKWGLLAAVLDRGGVISEVEAVGNLELNGDPFFAGGLVGVVDDKVLGAPTPRIQYSKFAGSIEWSNTAGDSPSSPSVNGMRIGGLVGDLSGPLEIRDSYAQVSFDVDSSTIYSTNILDLGGFVGGGGGTSSQALEVIRSYAVVAVTDQAVAGSEKTAQMSVGGLVGDVPNPQYDTFVSTFWNNSIPHAYGKIGSGTPPLDYTNSDPAFPEAAPLSTSQLQTLSTYRSREGDTAGEPSGLSDLALGASDGTLDEPDYLWAIEEGNVGTFVASTYDDEDAYLSRQLFTLSSGERSYRRQGAGDLAVHGGSDPEKVTGYPELGRVWEICSGESYPYLVWEERDCDAGASGFRSNDGGGSTAAAAAAALGLTEAEYAAFLASGLTLEQFKAARLAATGPNGALLVGGGSLTLLFLAAGAAILVALRRERRLGRL